MIKMRISRRSAFIIMLLAILTVVIGSRFIAKNAYGEEWHEIWNRTQLIDIKNDLNANYRLMADINLGGDAWVPIGSQSTPFNGKLDGNSRVISNFTITDTSTDNNGLFAAIGASGQISNLGVEGANITVGSYAGVLAGLNLGSVSRCYAKGSISGEDYVGGLIGDNLGQIMNCYSSVTVSGIDNFGGLAGRNSGTISKCYSSSAMNASVFNNYLTFDGVDDYIAIPHNNAYTGNAFTLEAWFQWNGVGTDGVQFIIGKGYEQFEIHMGGGSGTNGIRFIPIANVSGDSFIDVRDAVSPGWFHVAVVYEYKPALKQGRAFAKVYINGKLQSLWQKGINVGTEAVLYRATNTLSTNKDELDIGRRSNGTYYFNGKICDVRYWNTARTAAEIVADKDIQLTGAESGLVGYWKLDEATGTTAADSSSYHNDGTLMNGVTRGNNEAAKHTGGLVGINSGTVSDSFYDSQLSKQSDSGKGTAKLTSLMKQSDTYSNAGWDMSRIWGRSDGSNNGYPYLLEASKIITSFSFQALAPAINGIIDEAAGKINLYVPTGTSLTALTPTIAYMGSAVAPTTGSAQDFSDPVIYTVTAADGGKKQYTVTVYNTTAEPVIGTQPVNITGEDKHQAVFSVSAASTDGGALSYQWQRSMDGGTSWIAILGATNNTYTTETLSFGDDGSKYRCLVKNTTGCGEKTIYSDVAKLTVTAANNSTVDLSSWSGKASLIIPTGYNVTVTGSCSNIKVICNAGVTLNLQDVSIINTTATEAGFSPITFTGTGNTLNISGINTLNAGKEAPGINTTGADLTIRGTGSLTAKGGDWGLATMIGGAGIGSMLGSGSNITIESGTVTATGGISRGLKVPCGDGISANHIAISGGDVTGLGYRGGAGIGGGSTVSGSAVTILGGTVIANGSQGSVGIGCLGSVLNNNVITISGGRVIAKSTYNFGGTGIGSRALSTSSGLIRLTGGVIFANRNSTINSAEDIGNINTSNWSVEIGGTAAVFLQYDKSTVNTTTHVHDTFTQTGDVYGIQLPADWTAPYGAYLSHPQLSYNLNGGSGETPASVTGLAGTTTVVTGTAITVTGTAISVTGAAVTVTGAAISVSGGAIICRPGYNFTGWNTSADGKGIAYGLGDTLVFGNSDVTLYAIWEKIVLPGETTPGEATPGGTTPGGTTPGGTTPGGTTPGGTTPGGTMPGGTMPGGTTPGDTAQSSNEVIVVEVKQGNSEDTLAQLTVMRNTDDDGVKKDTVTFLKNEATDTVAELIVNGKDTARIVIPDEKDEVSESRINLPFDSLEVLVEGRINLKIDTEKVKIDLPKDTLANVKDKLVEDLYFNLVPVKQQDKKEEVVRHAIFEAGIINKSQENAISAVGIPVTIETNMPSSDADITLPLTGLVIPEDMKEREELFKQLAVYIEHSDGDKELVQGEIVNYKDGLYGIRFHITKFSIFTIVKSSAFTKVSPSNLPDIKRIKSSEAKIIKVTIPKNADINNTVISATTAADTVSINVKIQISKNATWKLYSDKECTRVMKGNKLKLKAGINKCYIKVTAEDGISNQVFALMITREKDRIVSNKCSIRLGLVGSKTYADKLVDMISEYSGSADVIVKREGKYYRVYADFSNKTAAKAACKDLIKKKYIINYYFIKN